METLTLWLGQVASGERNAFCNCGNETDRSKQLGVHISDGTGRIRLCCPACSRRYAADLARLAGIELRLTVNDLYVGSNSSKYTLLPVDEPLPCEELPLEELPT